MIDVLFAALCSVLVSVLLKLAPRLRFEIGQAVAWNYVVAAGLSLLFLKPSLTTLRAPGTPWLTLAALGVLLPTIFLALGASVRHAGIVRTDAAQRLSLLVPLLAAFTLFGETPAPIKLAGSALGLIALGCMVQRPGRDGSGSVNASWLHPLTVFAGFGAIDVLFKRVAAAGIPLGAALAATFTLALIVAFVIQLARRARFTARSALAGLLLGLCNFGNILFYLRAHRALPSQPSLVFARMNLGVVVLGALVGVVVFREKLGRTATVGLLLALAAIVLLTRG